MPARWRELNDVNKWYSSNMGHNDDFYLLFLENTRHLVGRLPLGPDYGPKLEMTFLACTLDKRARARGRVNNLIPSVKVDESERLLGYAGHSF